MINNKTLKGKTWIVVIVVCVCFSILGVAMLTSCVFLLTTKDHSDIVKSMIGGIMGSSIPLILSYMYKIVKKLIGYEKGKND